MIITELQLGTKEDFLKSCHAAFQQLVPSTFVPYPMMLSGRVLHEIPFWRGRKGEFQDQFRTTYKSDGDRTLEDDYVDVWNHIVDGLQSVEPPIHPHNYHMQLGSHFFYLKERLITVTDSLKQECFEPIVSGRLVDTNLADIWSTNDGNVIFDRFNELKSLVQRFIEGYPTLEDAIKWMKKVSNNNENSFEITSWKMHESRRDRILDTYQKMYLQYVCIQEMELLLANGKEPLRFEDYKGSESEQVVPRFISNKNGYNDVFIAIVKALVRGHTKDSVTKELISFRKPNGRPNKSIIAEYIGHKNGEEESSRFIDIDLTVTQSANYLKSEVFRKLDWDAIEKEVARQKVFSTET